MVNIKFRPDVVFDTLAFTVPSDLDTIYIPTQVLNNITWLYQDVYDLSPDEAKRAAELYLEERYPHILAHESAHLALGRVAQEEGLPMYETMAGYHNPIVREIEDAVDNLAQRHAVEQVYKEYKRRL